MTTLPITPVTPVTPKESMNKVANKKKRKRAPTKKKASKKKSAKKMKIKKKASKKKVKKHKIMSKAERRRHIPPYLSPYIMYNRDRRKQMKDGNVILNFEEAGKVISKEWKAMTPEDKLPFNELSTQHLEESKATRKRIFNTDKPLYRRIKESERQEKNKRAAARPTPPKTNYMFFVEKERPKLKEEDPNMSFTEKAITLGKRWRLLTEEQKIPYNKLNQKDKVRYEKDKAVMEKAAKQASLLKAAEQAAKKAAEPAAKKSKIN